MSLLIEVSGDFISDEEVLDVIHHVVNRLIFDEETGDVIGVLPEEKEPGDEIEVQVPEVIIAWAKKEAVEDTKEDLELRRLS